AREAALCAEDLERLAFTCRLLGNQTECADLLARAHQEFLNQGETARAARAAIWLAFHSHFRGDVARGNGWVARANRILKAHGEECVESGYLLHLSALRAFFEGDAAKAHTLFLEATKIGERFGDRDLMTLARHGQGRALIRMDQAPRGVSLLDEAMVAITAGDVSSSIVGDVYCSVIEGCHEIFDLRRAQEWTTALAEWCASQPDLVPYQGNCMVHRAQILQLHGAWDEAMEEARQARELFADPPGQRAIGGAYYLLGELFRLTGNYREAEQAYLAAGHHRYQPEPGLAQLKLAQGDENAATGAIRRSLKEVRDRKLRPLVLSAAVDIMLAVKELAEASAAAEELREMAKHLDAPYLKAAAAQAEGSVLLAQGKPHEALTRLRNSWVLWCALEAPYEAARSRVAIGLACRTLQDPATADLEFEAARREFHRLGAKPDLESLRRLIAPADSSAAGGLTLREVEVLREIAAGKSNRKIAQDLGISEKTVARHVSNIFTKLGLSSRAAATAYAYQHHLVNSAT
ncbi:MAG TPA: LuxR C-terminal-related transcriptional regulator, partial [Gemmatimonadales bacterium]